MTTMWRWRRRPQGKEYKSTRYDSCSWKCKQKQTIKHNHPRVFDMIFSSERWQTWSHQMNQGCGDPWRRFGGFRDTTYTWVIQLGGLRGAVDSLLRLQSRIWLSSDPLLHEHGSGQCSSAQALRPNSMKTTAADTGQSSAILNVFLARATWLTR